MRAVGLATLVAVGTTGLAKAEGYQVYASGKALLGLPAQTDRPVIFVRGSEGPWQPAEFRVENGRVLITIDPQRLGSPQIGLLFNPPAGVNINDSRPPSLTAIGVDGVALEPGPDVDLGPVSEAPRELTLRFEDGENPLDAESIRVFLDGQPLTEGIQATEVAPRTLEVRLLLPDVDFGHHLLRYSLADVSPQANQAQGQVRFSRFDMSNFALALYGTQLSSDSHFPNYDALSVLNDGNVKLAKDTLPPDATWASAETPEPHWVVVDFGQPRRIREIRIYWANYAHQFHTSRKIAIQVPEGNGWRTVYSSPPEGEPDAWVTTVAIEPTEVTRFRLWQPAGGGSPKRPNLLWLAEIEAR